MDQSRSHFVEHTGSCAGSRGRCLFAASRTVSLALLLFGLNTPAFANAEVSRLPPLLISDYPRDPVDSIQSTAKIDHSTLRASNKSDLDKVLRGLPGVTLQRSSRGSLSSFTLRGAASGQGQLMLDGIPLYGTLTGIFNLDGFAPELLENTAVERGPGGIRFGSQALGGTVRLSSRDAEQSGVGVHVQGGSYGTLSESVTGSLVSDRARATGVFRREDVFEGISQANVDNGNPERDGYWGDLALLRYAARPIDSVGLDGTFYHGLTRAKIDSPGITPSGRPGPMDDLSAYGYTETWLGQQTVTARLSPVWESSLKLGYHRSAPRVRMHGVTGESDSTLLFLRWRNEHTEAFGPSGDYSLRLAWGSEARQEEVTAQSILGAIDQRRGQVAGFADVDAGFGPLSLAGGFRFDHYDQFATHGTYYLGLKYQAAESLMLRASGGHGYRIPSYHEWYFPFFGNPMLRPESADSGQVGFDWLPSSDLRLAATAYYQRYRDLIQISFAPELGSFRSGNVPRADVRGVELEARYGSDARNIGISYTLQDSRDLDTGRSLARLPRHVGKVFGAWRFDGVPLDFGAEVLYRSGYFDDTGGSLRIGQYFQVNAQLVYTLVEQFQVYLRGENLNDDRTPDDFGFGKPGAAVYGGIKLEFH